MKKNVHFIGSGKLGTTLARAMLETEWHIPKFWIRDNYNSKEANRYLPGTIFKKLDKTGEIDSAKIIIITVPDNRIRAVAERLSNFETNWQDKIVIHTSGSLNSDELISLKLKGAAVGSVHPLQTFKSHFLSPKIFNGIFFAVEGDKKIFTFASMLCKDLKANMMIIESDQKLLYHIAAVSVSNLMNGLLHYGENLFSKLDIDQTIIRQMMNPIITASVKNYFQSKEETSLTGPLARGDFKVVEKHLSYLKNQHEDFLPVYSEISKYIVKFILDKDIKNYEQLIKVLADET